MGVPSGVMDLLCGFSLRKPPEICTEAYADVQGILDGTPDPLMIGFGWQRPPSGEPPPPGPWLG